MKHIVTAGLLLGVLCGLWTIVMGYTGWYRDPVMLNMFWVVILIEVGVLVWGLRCTAAEGRGYGGQFLAGLLISVIGGVVIMGSSLLFTSVLFPGYFAELAAMQEQMLRDAGQTDEQIAAAMDAYRATATPMMNALSGFLGTVFTGCLATLIIAIVVRHKPEEARALPAA